MSFENCLQTLFAMKKLLSKIAAKDLKILQNFTQYWSWIFRILLCTKSAYFNHTLLVSKLFVCKKPACYCHNAVTVYKYPHVEFEVSVICVYSQREMFTFGAWNTRDLYVKEAKQKLIHKGEFWGVSNYAPTNSSSM